MSKPSPVFGEVVFVFVAVVVVVVEGVVGFLTSVSLVSTFDFLTIPAYHYGHAR